MPLIDKPLEELKNYMGVNPRPQDFDEFWDKSIAEIADLDTQPMFKKSSYECSFADLFDFYFVGTKGAIIHSRVAIPKDAQQAPAVIKFHGLGGAADNWYSILPYAAEGYVIAYMDCRGQGGYSDDTGIAIGSTFRADFMKGVDDDPEHLLYRDIFLDCAILARLIMALECVDETRVAVMGGSQGGALSVACAALVPEIKLCCPTYPYLSDYKRVWDMDLDTGAYQALRYYFRKFDPTHDRENEIFTKLGYIDIQFLAPRIKAKVLMFTGLMDTICPPSTQFAMYNKLACEKDVIIYPDYGHEEIQGSTDLTFAFIRNYI